MSNPINTVFSGYPFASDAVYLFSVAEASVLGSPWLIVVGCDQDDAPEILSSSAFDALASAERLRFLTQAQAEIGFLMQEQPQTQREAPDESKS